MTKQEAIDFLLTKPYKFGHLLGFDKLTELHNEWIISMVRGKEDETLKASRGTYKTTCVSIALSLNVILLPTLRGLFMRKTDADVKEVIRQVQKILQDPHTQVFVNTIYGINLKLTTQSATEVTTNLVNDIKGTSQLLGMGIGSSITGKHFDRIFTDDIVNVDDRISKAERERTKLVYQELQNVKNRGGRIFNTGTTWHKDDAFSIMPKAKIYDCYHEKIRNVIITDEEIEHLKSTMLPSLFSANYELKFIASEDIIFDNPRREGHKGLAEQGIAHLDSAFYGEDYTAFTVCKKHDGIYYVYGRCWRKHVEECYADIIQLFDEFNCSKLYTETNADKGMVARDIKKLGVRTVTYSESMNKYIKIVTYLKSEWKNVVFVEGTDEEYIEQICEFNDQSPHDDCPDSLASCVRLLYNKTSDTRYQPIFM